MCSLDTVAFSGVRIHSVEENDSTSLTLLGFKQFSLSCALKDWDKGREEDRKGAGDEREEEGVARGSAESRRNRR